MATTVNNRNNSVWSLLSKVAVISWAICTTCLIPWSVYVTKTCFKMETHLANCSEFIKRIDRLENWDRENRDAHHRIELSLEKIKSKLGVEE